MRNSLKTEHFKRLVLCGWVIFITSFLSANNIAQRQNFVYPVSAITQLLLSNQHGNITIESTPSDSVYIKLSLSVNLDTEQDSMDFFAGVKYVTEFTKKRIDINLQVDQQVASNYTFNSEINITAPAHLVWSITNKFGNVTSNTALTVRMLSLDYGKLNVPSIREASANLSELTFFQADITTDTIENALLKAENSILNVKEFQKGVVKSEFSTWSVQNTEELTFTTETDNLYIATAHSLTIKGVYSDCTIKNITGELQTELIYGKFQLTGVSGPFKTINIDHKNVFTNLCFQPGQSFNFNADAKYCDIVVGSGLITHLKTIEEGASKIISGSIGAVEPVSSVTIVARFESIYVNACDQ